MRARRYISTRDACRARPDRLTIRRARTRTISGEFISRGDLPREFTVVPARGKTRDRCSNATSNSKIRYTDQPRTLLERGIARDRERHSSRVTLISRAPLKKTINLFQNRLQYLDLNGGGSRGRSNFLDFVAED